MIGRIVVGYQLRRLNSKRIAFMLCEEVIAVVGIGIAGTDKRILRCPGHRACSIENPSAIYRRGGHFLQIVCRRKVVARQRLWLQGSAITINPHTIDIRKTRLTDERLRQLIKAALWDTYLGPSAFA